MNGPKVRLLSEGELVSEVPFLGAPLRIGRLKGNDLVINNLSTSRFHATLTEQGGGFVLADLGSENGSWVNGRRVKECRVAPGDQIQIGKHDLVIIAAAGAAAQVAPMDAATEVVLDAAGVVPELEPLDTDGELAAPDEPIEALSSGGVQLFGDVGPNAPDLAEFDVSETDLREPALEGGPVPLESPTVLLSDDPDTTQMRPPPAAALEAPPLLEAVEVAAPEDPEPVPARAPDALHAGLILQRDGHLERVIQWELDRMTVGRAVECEVMLATPEISRRHALLVREDDRYEVRDLESINGTHVNGEKVTRRTLQSGDVIRVEDFEMTFVIDRKPIGAHVKVGAPPSPEAGAGDPGMTQFGEMMDLAPFVSEEAPETDSNAMSFEGMAPSGSASELPAPTSNAKAGLPAALDSFSDIDMPDAPEALEALEPETLEAAEVIEAPDALEATAILAEPDFGPEPEPDTMLLSDDGGEEKDLVEAPSDARVLRLELRIRLEELPPKLRDALAALDPADLRLPVELRMTTEGD